jgi:acetyl esterase/lipase
VTSARVVLSVPGEARIERVRNLGHREGDRSAMFDLYRPAGGDGTPPAVVFVHGDTADPARIAHAKDWGQYVSWGELCAAEGLAAIAFDHRSAHRGTRMPDVVADVEAVLDHLAANAEALRVDGTRVALVAVSMGVPFGLRVAFARTSSAHDVRHAQSVTASSSGRMPARRRWGT